MDNKYVYKLVQRKQKPRKVHYAVQAIVASTHERKSIIWAKYTTGRVKTQDVSSADEDLWGGNVRVFTIPVAYFAHIIIWLPFKVHYVVITTQ